MTQFGVTLCHTGPRTGSHLTSVYPYLFLLQSPCLWSSDLGPGPRAGLGRHSSYALNMFPKVYRLGSKSSAQQCGEVGSNGSRFGHEGSAPSNIEVGLA